MIDALLITQISKDDYADVLHLRSVSYPCNQLLIGVIRDFETFTEISWRRSDDGKLDGGRLETKPSIVDGTWSE
jgi:hypothetical protein